MLNRILIAEDEDRIASFVERGLRSNGFITTVVADGESAYQEAVSGAYDLLLLDIGLPKVDGFTVLRRLREARVSMPVVILTARDSVRDTVAGLEGGADDYIAKPFAFEELLARVRLRLRSDGSGTADATILQVGDLSLDLRTRRASIDGRTIDLTAREFLSPRSSAATPTRSSPANNSSPRSGASTSTPAPTSSTSTSATSARS